GWPAPIVEDRKTVHVVPIHPRPQRLPTQPLPPRDSPRPHPPPAKHVTRRTPPRARPLHAHPPPATHPRTPLLRPPPPPLNEPLWRRLPRDSIPSPDPVRCSRLRITRVVPEGVQPRPGAIVQDPQPGTRRGDPRGQPSVQPRPRAPIPPEHGALEPRGSQER